MTLRKIADAPVPCRHPQHNAPTIKEQGLFEHMCPACGQVTVQWMYWLPRSQSTRFELDGRY